MVERLSIKETTSRNWQYINIQCCFWTTFNAEPESFEGCMEKNGLAHERKYVANNCQCTIAASACCMVLYLSNLVHLVGCVWRKTLLSDICSTICKINVCFRANNVCFAVTWQSSTIKKKTFPWTQRTPLKRQFVERTAAWFWSHWWMVPKTNHLFVCKKMQTNHVHVPQWSTPCDCMKGNKSNLRIGFIHFEIVHLPYKPRCGFQTVLQIGLNFQFGFDHFTWWCSFVF